MHNITTSSPIIHVFADGSCYHNNGTRRPIGGVGVFVEEGHPENIGRSVREGRITNQNMELLSALMGLQVIARIWQPGEHATLYTDSIYVMNCMTKWTQIWEVNGWTTKNKRPVQNGDILRAMLPIAKQCCVTFVRVQPHGEPGKELEDERLAAGNRGAAALAMLAATDGSRSGCYIKRGMCVNSGDMLSGG